MSFKFPLGVLSGLLLFFSNVTFAITVQGKKGSEVNLSADIFRRSKTENKVEGEGNVFVSVGKLKLSANKVEYSFEDETIKATGNVILIEGDTTVYAKDINLHVPTKTGWMNFGQVNSPKYTLQGRQLRRTSKIRYEGVGTFYSTCKDCPRSWLIASEHVDITKEGYAKMNHAFIRLWDYPVLYFPYMIFPVKKERQSGVLFPEFKVSEKDGSTTRLPIFIEMGPNMDMTLWPGQKSKRGWLLDTEYRYIPTHNNSLNVNTYYISDKIHQSTYELSNRYRFNVNTYLGSDYYFKSKLQQISDNRFPLDFPDSGEGKEFSVLRSHVSTGYQTDNSLAYIQAQYYEDLLDTDPTNGKEKPNEIANRSINHLPEIGYYKKSKKIFENNGFISYRTSFDRLDRRGAEFYDVNKTGVFDDEVDYSREAQRFSFEPSFSYPIQANAWRLDPRVTMYNRVYRSPYGAKNTLHNSHLLLNARSSFFIDKIFRYDHYEYDAFKHKIGPFVEYQMVPVRTKSHSNFFEKGPFADGERLDEHLITPGFLQTVVSRKSKNNLSLGDYSETLRMESKFPIDVRQINQIKRRNETDGIQRSTSSALGPLQNNLSVSLGLFNWYVNHTFAQDKNKHTLNTGLKIQFDDPGKYDIWYREISGRYISERLDPLLAQESVRYGFRYPILEKIVFVFEQEVGLAQAQRHRLTKESYEVTYQHYSKCWRLVLSLNRDLAQDSYEFNFNVPINLTGSFTNVGAL